MPGLPEGVMCQLMSKSRFNLVAAGCLLALISAVGVAVAASPEDDRVSEYFSDRQLNDLLEVQLFDRLTDEKEAVERSMIARRLGGLYLAELMDETLAVDARREVLLKGRVLVGMMPSDELIGLRLELLVGLYKEHEQDADLDRIGLLSDDGKALGVEAMKVIVPELARIAKVSDAQVEQLVRNVSRAADQRVEDHELMLANARGNRSRANFFYGWAGYSEAALDGREVGLGVFKAFGWVLGFEGKLPVLDRLDMDLLEYDHVARAMLGVALSKLHNGNTGEARVWLQAVENSADAPEFAVHFAKQRLLEVALVERDWIASERLALRLRDLPPDSLLGVSQARLLVMRTMGNLGNRNKGKGGREGATELARIGLGQLVELGEIGQVLDLHTRYGSLPLLESGFVSLYTRGLSELEDGDAGNGSVSYSQASVKFGQALSSDDAERYPEHAGDAALKLAYCEIRLDRPGEAAGVLDSYSHLMLNKSQQQEAAWMQVLAHDAAVQGGQDQMSEKLTSLVGQYIRAYPSTERANTLIVRYAMTSHLDAGDAFGSLVIDDPSDPLAIPARRKLIQMLYKSPELIDGGEDALHHAVVGHAEWLWRNEPREMDDARDGQGRLTVCRIVLGTGLELDSVDHGYLMGVIDRGERILADEPSLVGARSELEFRRVQVLLLRGDIERAGEIAMGSGGLDEAVRSTSLLMVYEQANQRFKNQQSVAFAQAVVRYGRGVIDELAHDRSEGLDRRLSLVVEGMAAAAEYLSIEIGTVGMREYASALSLRVFHEGVPSSKGLVRTAVLGEEYGHSDIALECWLRLVGQLRGNEELWHRARFESLRLMMAADAERGRAVYRQYVTLYPEGSPEPWGAQIGELFGDQDAERGEP